VYQTQIGGVTVARNLYQPIDSHLVVLLCSEKLDLDQYAVALGENNQGCE
jgi:hypothetical protein